MRNKIFVFALLAGTFLSLLSCTNSKIKLTKTQQDMALAHPSDEKWYEWKVTSLITSQEVPYLSLWSTYDPDLFRSIPPQAPVRIEFTENDEYDSVVYVSGAKIDSSKKELEKLYDFFLDTRSYDESKETPQQYDDYFFNQQITLLGEQLQSGQMLDEKHMYGYYYCFKKNAEGMKPVHSFGISGFAGNHVILDCTSGIRLFLISGMNEKNYNGENDFIYSLTDSFYSDGVQGLIFPYESLPIRKYDVAFKSLSLRFNKKTCSFFSGFDFDSKDFTEPNPFLQVQATLLRDDNVDEYGEYVEKAFEAINKKWDFDYQKGEFDRFYDELQKALLIYHENMKGIRVFYPGNYELKETTPEGEEVFSTKWIIKDYFPKTIAVQYGSKLTLDELKAQVTAKDFNNKDIVDFSWEKSRDSADFDSSKPGTYSYFVTATDQYGQSSTIQVDLKVADVVPPTIDWKEEVEHDGDTYSIGLSKSLDMTESDVLDLFDIKDDSGKVSQTVLDKDISSGYFDKLGDYPLVITAKDETGNTSTKKFIVRVVQDSAPTFSLPAGDYIMVSKDFHMTDQDIRDYIRKKIYGKFVVSTNPSDGWSLDASEYLENQQKPGNYPLTCSIPWKTKAGDPSWTIDRRTITMVVIG